MDAAFEVDLALVVARIDAGRAVTPAWLRRRFPASHRRLARAVALMDALGPPPVPWTELGPFRILRRIGSGSTGDVYLAELGAASDVGAAGSRVALKVFREDLVESPGAVERILREAAVGRAVRHENVVRTLAAGSASVEGGRDVTFLALEHVEGQTLRSLLDEVGALPEATVRRVARDVARGLAAIHAAGVVHCDVKPENVLLAIDGTVKVMDLGVSCAISEALRRLREGRFAGTLLYAAPEQFGGGRPVDGRADLWALGVLISEMAKGEHPLATPGGPGPARRAVPRSTPLLDAVVERLTDRSPSRRFQTATEVATVLDECERSAWWQRRRASATAQVSLTLRGTPFRGRRGELRLLRECWRRAAAGHGSVALVVGPAGIGKSRLVEETLDLVCREMPDARVVVIRHAPGADEQDSDDLAAALRSALPRPAASRRNTPPEGRPPVGPREHPSGDVATRAAVVDAVDAISSRHPAAIVVEDLHFAGDAARRLFTTLCSAVAGRRVLVLATARPEDPDVSPPLDAGPRATMCALAPLAPGDAACLVADAFRSDPRAADISVVVASAAEGNPYFALEIVRDMAARGAAVAQPDGTWVLAGTSARVRIPRSVRALVAERVRALDPDDRSLLAVAACCGREFDAGLAASAFGRPEIDVHRRLARLARRGGLVRAHGATFVFEHHLLQEALHAAVPPARRRAIHRRLAQALQAAIGTAPEPAASARLCVHFLASDRPAGAAPYVASTLAHHVKTGRPDLCLEIATRALRAKGLLAERERLETSLTAASAAISCGRHSVAGALVERVVRDAARLGCPDLLLRARHSRGLLLLQMGRLPEAVREFEEVVTAARAADDRWLEGRALDNLSGALMYLGDPARALEGFRRHAEIAPAVGDTYGFAAATMNAGIALHLLGRIREALPLVRRGAAEARRIDSPKAEACATGVLGIFALEFGQFARAERLLDHTLATRRRCGDLVPQSFDHVQRSRLALAMGRPGTALVRAGTAEQLARDHRQDVVVADALRMRGDALATLGELVAAREAFQQMEEIAARVAWRDEDAAQARISMGSAASAAAETDTAERLLAEALVLAGKGGCSETVLAAATALADHRFEAGRLDEAAALLRDAIEASPGAAPIARRAAGMFLAISTGDAAGAERTLRTLDKRLHFHRRLLARLRIAAQRGGSRTVLGEAWQILETALDDAGSGRRRAMLENVRLHREIAAAWRQGGGG